MDAGTFVVFVMRNTLSNFPLKVHSAKLLQCLVHQKIDERVLYNASTAVQLYQQQGGHLTDPHEVGRDPLIGNTDKWEMRHQAICEIYPSFDDIFTKTINNDFNNALKFYIDITRRISSANCTVFCA